MFARAYETKIKLKKLKLQPEESQTIILLTVPELSEGSTGRIFPSAGSSHRCAGTSLGSTMAQSERRTPSGTENCDMICRGCEESDPGRSDNSCLDGGRVPCQFYRSAVRKLVLFLLKC